MQLIQLVDEFRFSMPKIDKEDSVKYNKSWSGRPSQPSRESTYVCELLK